MKRPIAELLTMSVKPGAEAERAQDEREAWQILRRKQGYVTHRVYQDCAAPLERLVYSEWESRKAVDGARQSLQHSPLMRRARNTLAAPPHRLVCELIGPLTSSKGLDVPLDAVAACGFSRLKAGINDWHVLEREWSATLAARAGYITHLLLRGFDDPALIGSLSHWTDRAAFQSIAAEVAAALDPRATLAEPPQFRLYGLVRS